MGRRWRETIGALEGSDLRSLVSAAGPTYREHLTWPASGHDIRLGEEITARITAEHDPARRRTR